MSNTKDTLALHAHTMRQAPTESEARLWRVLRASQLGVAFRRQVPLLGFIADFYVPSVRLVVEVDGGYHERRASADARRDRKLSRAGYRTLRVSAELVARDLAAVVATIAAACRQAPSALAPCPAGCKLRPFPAKIRRGECLPLDRIATPKAPASRAGLTTSPVG